jgi:hypothetical protein
MYLYLCPKAKENLSHIIQIDELDSEYINIEGKKFSIDETPHIHHNVNIIGLMALNYLGFTMIDGVFELERLPGYF